jgi:hypothetical protein
MFSDESLGLSSQVEIVGLTFTPRTLGARLLLTDSQLGQYPGGSPVVRSRVILLRLRIRLREDKKLTVLKPTNSEYLKR